MCPFFPTHAFWLFYRSILNVGCRGPHFGSRLKTSRWISGLQLRIPACRHNDSLTHCRFYLPLNTRSAPVFLLFTPAMLLCLPATLCSSRAGSVSRRQATPRDRRSTNTEWAALSASMPALSPCVLDVWDGSSRTSACTRTSNLLWLEALPCEFPSWTVYTP